jgi:hypothetical protein
MPEQQPSPYNVADLIQLIGQSTVELAYLRSQIAALQARVDELEKHEKAPDNGQVRSPAEVISPT